MAIEGKRVLSAAWGELRVNNVTWGEVTGVNLDVEITREDVKFGLGMDSKITGVSGSGTITVDKVYSRFVDVFKDIQKGNDTRVDLYLKVEDPDATDSQIETVSVKGAWLNSFPIGFGEKTGKVTGEFSIGFNPVETSFADTIK